MTSGNSVAVVGVDEVVYSGNVFILFRRARPL